MNEITGNELRQIEKNILRLKQKTIQDVIQMGNELLKAKAIVPHGEWGRWLEEKIEVKQRTANQIMRVAREFGSNSQAITNLEATKVYLLMELPSEDRENFILQNDLKGMSTREIKTRMQEYKRNNTEIWRVVDRVKDSGVYDVRLSGLKPLPNHEQYFWSIKGKDYVSFLNSIQTCGVVNPILITRDMTIVSGHERVRACKDLGMETIPATYFTSKNNRNMKLDDLLLHTFFECNMHTRSSAFYLARAWDELYFGNPEKVDYYKEKFINEGTKMDKELDERLEKKKIEIQNIRRKRESGGIGGQ